MRWPFQRHRPKGDVKASHAREPFVDVYTGPIIAFNPEHEPVVTALLQRAEEMSKDVEPLVFFKVALTDEERELCGNPRCINEEVFKRALDHGLMPEDELHGVYTFFVPKE